MCVDEVETAECFDVDGSGSVEIPAIESSDPSSDSDNFNPLVNPGGIVLNPPIPTIIIN